MEPSFIVPAKFDCPVARQNFSFLATAHDWESRLSKAGHLHDDVIRLQLPECILLQSVMQMSHKSDSSQKKKYWMQ